MNDESRKPEIERKVTGAEKKPWEPLQLRSLDVPTGTRSARSGFKTDPTEDFMLYKTS